MNEVIRELHTELQTVLRSLPVFSTSGFAVFDVDDMETQTTNLCTYPAVGVMYEGMMLADTNKTPGGTAVSAYSGSAVLLDVQFSVIIALQYGFAGQGEDVKWSSFGLLDQSRRALLGYQKANTRPWRFVGERPEVTASDSTLVFYSQVWRTYVPFRGSFNN